MNTQTKIRFVLAPKKVANPMQEKLKLDVDETRVRRAAEALEETIHNARQAQRQGAGRTVFVP